MKRNISWKWIAAFVPALVLMTVIFFFSATSAEGSTYMSDTLSYRVIEMVNRLPFWNWSDVQMLSYAELLHYPIRKVAHFTEYGMLGLSICLPLLIGKERKWKYVLWAVGISFLYACSDEIHQLFVPGRDGNFRDVLIDTSGAAFFALAVKALIFRRKYRKKEGEA